jgi:uncharacterized repeat protein (TIGR01451 family)
LWGLGERITIPFPLQNLSSQDYENIQADIIAVDEQMNAVKFIGDLSLSVVSDVGIDITTSNPSPQLGENVSFTISITNPGGIVDAKNVSIFFRLPESFSLLNFNAEQGSYNQNTGLWQIGDLELKGTPVRLTIHASFVEVEEMYEFTQLCLLIDGSGSVRNADWNIMRKGLSEAIKDSSIFPHSGVVELTIIQFAQNGAFLEIGPTIIDSSTYNSVATALENLNQRNGGTPLGSGFKRAADTLYASSEFDEDNRQVINIITDGMPNRDCSYTPGVYTGKSVNYNTGKASAVEWRNYLIDTLSMTEEKDEISSLAVGILSGYYTSGPDSSWLNSSIIWPPPGCIAPPFDAGRSWVREVEEWNHLYEAIREMFRIMFQGIWINCEINDSYPLDPNNTNDRAQLLILPEPP